MKTIKQIEHNAAFRLLCMGKVRWIVTLMGLFLLVGCSGDDFAADNGDDTDEQRFSVSVSDGGYSSANGGLQTRAVETGYTTEFTTGDRMGIFAMKDGAIRSEVNNLCLTASIEGGNLVWKDASGNAPLKFSGATYYAYYPYQATLTGTLDASASDAAGFFADLISSWAPSTDQGTYSKYTAQDLMVAKGSIGSNGLSFAMQHQMALVVIELPGTKYEFNNINPSISYYITDPLDTRFDNYSPYRMTDGTYRYLVNTGSSTSALTGRYTNTLGAAKGWEIKPTSISSGSYKLYRVDGGVATVVSDYNLQVGDYMLKNGALVSKDATLSSTQKANCMGVVFYVGDDTYGGTHGKIVSLNQQNFIQWGDNYIDEQAAGVEGIRNFSDGYLGTFNLISKRKDQPNFSATYGAFYWIHQKNNNDVNGIWYMPAIDELTTLYNIQGIINPKIISADGTAVHIFYYLSSTEYASNGVYHIAMASGIVHSNPGFMSKAKGSDRYVRGIAKF